MHSSINFEKSFGDKTLLSNFSSNCKRFLINSIFFRPMLYLVLLTFPSTCKNSSQRNKCVLNFSRNASKIATDECCLGNEFLGEHTCLHCSFFFFFLFFIFFFFLFFLGYRRLKNLRFETTSASQQWAPYVPPTTF